MLVFIHDNFKLDLTYLNVTFTELNQWFKDDFSTEQSIPFELYLDSDLAKNSGFSAHYNANTNQTIFDGYLDKDGDFTKAVLTFQSIRGKLITAIINAGIDNFPSFDKKLSELPLETKLVSSIVDDAKSVIQNEYPGTNYNFPMVHTNKYDPEASDWNGFQKIINNYVSGNFIENELDLATNIDLIKNIMQPLPYLMHVIKAGITFSGKTLAGDILTDDNINRALIFRDGDYYDRLSEEEIPLVLKNNEWLNHAYDLYGHEHVEFNKEIVIEKKGDYLLFGDVVKAFYISKDTILPSSALFLSVYKISGSTTTILHNYEENAHDPEGANLEVHTIIQDFDMPLSLEAGDIIQVVKIEPRRDLVPSMTPDYPEAVSLKIIPIRFKNPDGSPIISVSNVNEIDLTRVVPDMTFRDLITIIKNWFNYELIPSGDIVYMNFIEGKLNRDSAVNMSEYDIEEPERTFHEDREFELAFSDGKADDTYKYDSVLITKQGVTLNPPTIKDTVNSIKIDALPLPVITRNGVTTAISFTDETSKLRLVFMEPMIQGYTPVTFHNENVLIPKIHETKYFNWLNFRINSVGWHWDFTMSAERFREVSIQTLTYAYSNYHIYSEIEKERLNSMFWRITAKSESLV